MKTLLIISCILIMLILIFFARKITKKSYKICISIANILVCSLFVVLFLVLGYLNTYLNIFVDLQINNLENSVNEIYSGALTTHMETTEIKEILEKSLVRKKNGGMEDVVINIIKLQIEKYTSSALSAITSLERTSNKLSVKDALISIKELTLDTITPYLKISRIILLFVFLVYSIASIILSCYLSKERQYENKSIVFGEEADKTFIGMKTED